MTRSRESLTVLLACVVILACIGFLGWGHQSQASSHNVWEYKVVSISTTGPESVGEPERSMNQLGTQGWEFVQIIRDDEIGGMQGKFLFKRAK